MQQLSNSNTLMDSDLDKIKELKIVVSRFKVSHNNPL